MFPDRLITIAVLFCAAAALVISLLAFTNDESDPAIAAPSASPVARDYCAQLSDLATAVNPNGTNPFWGLAFSQLAGDPPQVVPGSLLDRCLRSGDQQFE
jgi:hypothetical protein